MILQNAGNYSPNGTASYPKGLESSETPPDVAFDSKEVMLRYQGNKTSETVWLWFLRDTIGARLINRVMIEDIYM
jgi:hypothetical protein